MSEPFIGQIIMLGFNWNPRGYALCQGQLLPVNQNQAMFALLGTQFGGNGTNNFGLPDLRSRFPIGQGQGPGLTFREFAIAGGLEADTLVTSQMPIHTHAITQTTPPTATTTVGTNGGPGDQKTPGGNVLAKGSDSQTGAPLFNYSDAGPDGSVLGGVVTSVTPGNQTLSNAGGSMPFTIMNPFLAINYCIATVGIYPTRS